MSLLGAFSSHRVPSLGESTALLEHALSHRSELAAIELGEARRHAQGSALLLAVCAVLVLWTGLAFTLTITVLVWASPQRGWWLAGLTAVYLIGATLAALALHRRLQTWQPFAAIKAQLQQDHQCLHQVAKSILP